MIQTPGDEVIGCVYIYPAPTFVAHALIEQARAAGTSAAGLGA